MFDKHLTRLYSRFSKISVECPNCNQKGYLRGRSYLVNRVIFRIAIDNGTHLVEFDNINCICDNCKGGSRISNGIIIKRPRKLIEIPIEYVEFGLIFLFLMSFIAFFLPIGIGLAEGLEKIDENNIYLSWLIAFPLLAVVVMGTLYSRAKPVFLIEKSIDEIRAAIHIPSSNEVSLLYKERKYLAQQVMQHKEALENKNQVIAELKPVFSQVRQYERLDSEKVLQLFLADNLQLFQFKGKNLSLFQENGRNGVEFQTDVGRIDILAKDEDGNWLVIETKLDRTPDKTMGQLSRYMGWVKEHLNLDGKEVYGLIIGYRINEKLLYATSMYENIFLMEYDTGVLLRNVNLRGKNHKRGK